MSFSKNCNNFALFVFTKDPSARAIDQGKRPREYDSTSRMLKLRHFAITMSLSKKMIYLFLLKFPDFSALFSPAWPWLQKISSYASVNSKHQHPPGQPPGFCTYFQPWSRDLYHLNFPGIVRASGLLSIIISTELSVDSAWRHFSTSN